MYELLCNESMDTFQSSGSYCPTWTRRFLLGHVGTGSDGQRRRQRKGQPLSQSVGTVPRKPTSSCLPTSPGPLGRKEGGMPKIRICTSPTPQEWRRGHLKLGRAEVKQNQISLGHLPSKGLAKLESTVSGEVCSENLLQRS